MALDTDDMDEVTARIVAALPPEWHAYGLTKTVSLDGRLPLESWSIEFRWGAQIDGGRPMRYVGGESIAASVRRVEVTVSGTIEQLVAAAGLVGALEPLGTLPWPSEFSVSGWIV